MRKRHGYVFWGIGFLAAVFFCAGCSGKKESVPAAETLAETETTPETMHSIVLETEEETEPEEPAERVEVNGKIRSYLTGEMVAAEKADRRPVAVMMSNDRQALPQYGINRAGVVYEAPVEGDMNRYMALIEDYDDLERIGSVRSCRTYYTYFAREFDAVYVHYGQSNFAVPYLKNVDHINGVDSTGSSAFYRSRDKKAPHNAYTSGAKLREAVEKQGISDEYSEDYEGHFRFASGSGQITPENGEDAYKVAPGYPMNSPWFEYNEEDGLYYRFQYGAPHNGSEGQIAVKNIIFQYVEYGYYATTPYLNINVHTGHEGRFFTNGKYEKITWEKDGEFGVTHYYDMEGNEITLNKGKTWVCIIQTDRYDKAEIYGK